MSRLDARVSDPPQIPCSTRYPSPTAGRGAARPARDGDARPIRPGRKGDTEIVSAISPAKRNVCPCHWPPSAYSRAGFAADELPTTADHGERDGNLQSGEDRRQRIRQADLEEGGGAKTIERQIDLPVRSGAAAGRRWKERDRNATRSRLKPNHQEQWGDRHFESPAMRSAAQHENARKRRPHENAECQRHADHDARQVAEHDLHRPRCS